MHAIRWLNTLFCLMLCTDVYCGGCAMPRVTRYSDPFSRLATAHLYRAGSVVILCTLNFDIATSYRKVVSLR